MAPGTLKCKIKFCKKGKENMLSGQLVLFKQEIDGDYSFGDELKILSTKGFFETFGEEALELVYTSRALIQMQYEKPDRIQYFEYKDIMFKCICDFHKGDKVSDYEDLDEMFMIFMLQEED